MKYRKILLILIIFICLFISACTNNNQSGYTKYSYEFLGTFDTVIQIMGYAEDSDEFEAMAKICRERFLEFNKLYDIYKDYDGINNIKTINDNAGIKPVEVQQEIIDLLLFSKEWYNRTNGKCNIALGSVLSIWHDYRNASINNPEKAEIPPPDMLKEAMRYTDINKVIVDEDNNTVYLEDKNMRLDVGAVAKGFATEIVANELIDKGYTSFIISSGGNVRTVGKPMDSSRKKWGIGIQNPDGNPNDPDEPSLDILYLNDKSLVTSGDYQRWFEVNGEKYHHLIDPVTLMPAQYYRAVSVVTEDSGIADFMSTTMFLTPYQEGRKLAESIGIDVIWIMKDGTIEATENARKVMKYLGEASNKDN
ncbi:MAG TPA: FAD:protein FMN transferase [Clostridiaceae bacterium]|jgi:thiamine biosynthesis lipoprotein|nr:FAD:protein FMN transferase [Clostridiaceae bacterium]